MNKLLSRIAIAIASFAMVIGGASTVSLRNKEQANPVYAENGDVVAMFDGYKELGSSHTEHITYHGWKLSWGHSYKCGFDVGEWKTIKEQGYSKYINDTTISPDTYGWVLTKIDPLTFVGGFDFQAYYPPASYLYLTYSLDDITYSLVPLTNGSQGAKLDTSHQTQSFDFNSIREAYYAIVVISETTNPASNQYFEFDYVLCHFYEKIDPSAERITVSGPNAVYADEDIELTITAYNFNPTEYTLTSSDTSIATVSRNGNRAIIHGVNKGTAYITVSTDGTNGIVYTDPFAITVKKFDFRSINTSSIALSIHENKIIDGIYYQDNNGDIVLEAVSANTNAVTVRTLHKSCAIITAGNIGGFSTTITLTAKDNNGAEGCHVVTRTIQVTVCAHRFLGEMVVTATYDEKVPVYVATMDRSHYLTVIDNGYGEFELTVTDNFEEATLFNYYWDNLVFVDSYGEPEYLCYSGSINGISVSSQSCDFYFIEDGDKYNGALSLEGHYFIYYTIDMGEVCLEYESIYEMDRYDEDGIISLSNVFCAYYAVESDPSITPEEASIELTENESIDITATVESVNSATYEILSGSQCIEEVIVSEINDLNQFNIHIEASSNATGTAVIRIKDANDDSVYTDITVVVKNTTKLSVGTISTQAKLSYEYARDGEGYDISNVAIRFGGMIDKDTWDILDNTFGIDAFGVMLSNTNNIEQHADEKIDDAGSLEAATTEGIITETDIKVFSSDQTPAEEGNYYFWNLYKMINATERGLTREYTAVAFILTSDGDVVFFDEATKSAALLAKEAIDTIDNINETTDGSMGYIASFYTEN